MCHEPLMPASGTGQPGPCVSTEGKNRSVLRCGRPGQLCDARFRHLFLDSAQGSCLLPLLSFLEFLLNMNDDGTFANQGMVNAVHTGWNTCRYGCRRQNCIGRTLGLSQGSIQRGSISSTPCEFGSVSHAGVRSAGGPGCLEGTRFAATLSRCHASGGVGTARGATRLLVSTFRSQKGLRFSQCPSRPYMR